VNIGYLFAGNTSTGVLGIQTARGHVYTAGLSIVHDLNARLALGGEVYGGYTNNGDLGRTQLQFMVGGQFQIRNGMSFDFGALGGKYIASPRVGAQVGFSVVSPYF